MAAPPLTRPSSVVVTPASRRRATYRIAAFNATAVIALTAIGLVLRLRGLVVPWRDIWIDEAFSIWLANLPPWQAIQVIARVDQHPPFYALLMHLWLLPRDDPWWARLSSALLGAATVPLAALLGRAAAGRRLGLIAACLVACSPDLVRYSQEVRPYALIVFLVTFATLFLVLAIDRGERRLWVTFGVTMLFLVYTDNVALLLVPAQGLFVLWIARRDPAVAKPYALTMAGVGLLWLLWLPALLHQTHGVLGRWHAQQPSWDNVSQAVVDYLNASTPSPLSLGGHVIALGSGVALLLLPFGVLVLLGAVAGARRYSLLFLATFAVPIMIVLLMSHVRSIFDERSLLYASVGLTMLVAGGIAACRLLPLGLLLLLPILGLNLISLDNQNRSLTTEDWHDVANYVAEKARPGDVVLFNGSWVQLAFDYYYRNIGMLPLSEHGLPVDLFQRGELELPMLPADVPGIASLTKGRQHVWLVLSHDDWEDPQHLIRPAMKRLFPNEEEHWHNHILLLYYSR